MREDIVEQFLCISGFPVRAEQLSVRHRYPLPYKKSRLCDAKVWLLYYLVRPEKCGLRAA